MPIGGFGIGAGVANARQAHAGATNVSGIGGAIRGILEDARAKGLLGAQSAFQTAGANQNAILKENRELERENDPQRLDIITAGGGINRQTTTRGAKQVTAPAQTVLDPTDALVAEALERFKNKTPNIIQQGAGARPATSDGFTSEDEVISAFQAGQIQIGDIINLNGQQFRFDGI